MPESLLSQIMLGYTTADKAASQRIQCLIGGLAKIFNENGIKFSKKTKVSDVYDKLASVHARGRTQRNIKGYLKKKQV